jgi:hypothetical protein
MGLAELEAIMKRKKHCFCGDSKPDRLYCVKSRSDRNKVTHFFSDNSFRVKNKEKFPHKKFTVVYVYKELSSEPKPV